MFNQLISFLRHFLFLFLIVYLFTSCQEKLIEPNNLNVQSKSLKKDPTAKVRDTYVRGIVYKEGSTRSGSTVKLYKGTQYLTQTTSDSNGKYIICVCCQSAGAGTYYVKGFYVDKWGDTWTDTESFYYDPWSNPPPPLYIEKDLYLQMSK